MLAAFGVKPHRLQHIQNLFLADLPPYVRQKAQILVPAVIRQKARRFNNGSNVLRHVHVTSHTLAVHEDHTLLRVHQTADALKKHRFAGAVAPYDAVYLPLFKRDRYVLQNHLVAKALHHVLYFNTSFHKDSFHTDFSTSMFRLRSVTHEAADKAANKANSANKIYVRLGYIELPS